MTLWKEQKFALCIGFIIVILLIAGFGMSYAALFRPENYVPSSEVSTYNMSKLTVKYSSRCPKEKQQEIIGWFNRLKADHPEDAPRFAIDSVDADLKDCGQAETVVKGKVTKMMFKSYHDLNQIFQTHFKGHYGAATTKERPVQPPASDEGMGPLGIAVGGTLFAVFMGGALWYAMRRNRVQKDVNDAAVSREMSGAKKPSKTKVWIAKKMNKWRKKHCEPGRARDLLPGEIHYKCHNFTGPGTRLDIKEIYDYEPYNKIDACAKKHDIQYSQRKFIEDKAKRLQAIRDADDELIRCVEQFKDERPRPQGYHAARSGMLFKEGTENAIKKFVKGPFGLYSGDRSIPLPAHIPKYQEAEAAAKTGIQSIV